MPRGERVGIRAILDRLLGDPGLKGTIGDLNTRVLGGSQTYEVTEVGLHPYMLGFANDGFRGCGLLPVFPLRTFRHKSMTVEELFHPSTLELVEETG